MGLSLSPLISGRAIVRGILTMAQSQAHAVFVTNRQQQNNVRNATSGYAGQPNQEIVWRNTWPRTITSCFNKEKKRRKEKMACKGVCSRYKLTRKNRGSSGFTEKSGYYTQEHGKRCTTCAIFIRWEGIYCPCCGYHLRARPRKSQEKREELKRKRNNYNKLTKQGL